MEEIVYKIKASKEDVLYYHKKPGKLTKKNENTVLNATSTEVKPLDSANIIELTEIKDKVLNKELALEKSSIQDFGTVAHEDDVMTIASGGVSAVYNSLEYDYGAQFTNKYVMSLTRDGITGQLYQHKTFGATPKSSFLFDALTAIGVIATWAGTPVSGLIGIASWISSAGGYYVLMNPTNITTWNAYVYNEKFVKVGNISPYRSNYDIAMIAATGDNDWALLTDRYTKFKHEDYDSSLTVLANGIDVYKRLYSY